MSRKCVITHKGAQNGHNVSHAKNKTNKVTNANLHKKRLFDSESGQWITLKVSSRALRIIDKKGLSAAIREHAFK